MNNNGGYHLVSGTGRSGTSAMMLCLRQAGIPIIGFKFGVYLGELTYGGNRLDCSICPSDERKRINKNGFWEIMSLAIHEGLTDYYKDIGIEGDVIKVFTSVLPKSNPDLIDKTILMFREPKAVLTSMINADEFTKDNASQMSKRLARHTINSIRFLEDNNKEFKIVIFERLLEDPEKVMKEVCEFFDRGDYKLGAEVIDVKLNRSKNHINDLGDISELEKIYQKYGK